MNTIEREYDLAVIGGGTAGPMAAIKAKEANRELRAPPAPARSAARRA
jgi:succinate dehydrogenase/fumarate reductase flavoprotein subunit